MVTWEEVRSLIEEVCVESNATIEKDTKIMDDLRFDSIAVMELLTKIEEEFEVDFMDLEEFEERFNRCGDLYEGIVELIKEKK